MYTLLYTTINRFNLNFPRVFCFCTFVSCMIEKNQKVKWVNMIMIDAKLWLIHLK